MKDMSYAAVMGRKNEIMKASMGMDYNDFSQSPIAFDYERMMAAHGYSLDEIVAIQTRAGVGNTPLLELSDGLPEIVTTAAQLERVAADLAAGTGPVAIDAAGLPAELVAKEREIYLAQAQESGKPADIVQKMVEGRVKKFMQEVTLLGQPFVKDPETTVAQLLAKHKARVIAFERFAVGEGLEKKSGNFAEEVMAQAGR